MEAGRLRDDSGSDVTSISEVHVRLDAPVSRSKSMSSFSPQIRPSPSHLARTRGKGVKMDRYGRSKADNRGTSGVQRT